MKNYQQFERLSPIEQSQFIDNILEYYVNQNGVTYDKALKMLDDYLNEDVNQNRSDTFLTGFVASAFYWSETQEGNEYWRIIAQRLYDLN